MFSKGQIIYFTPFWFKNGGSKNKYFIVLRNIGDSTIVASLPTSINHIPNFLTQSHGCINDDENRVNCYLFEQEKIICDNGFYFDLHTYIHGNEVEDYEVEIFKDIYKNIGDDYKILGTLIEEEFEALVKCIIDSKSVKKRVKRLLSE